MRPYLALISGVAAVAGIAASVGIAPAQEPQLAREGRGLLPPPAEIPATLGGTPPPHLFVKDPSGGFSRTIFETDEDPNFKIVIRDFSFPPDRQNAGAAMQVKVLSEVAVLETTVVAKQ